jgi:hypothetical protein
MKSKVLNYPIYKGLYLGMHAFLSMTLLIDIEIFDCIKTNNILSNFGIPGEHLDQKHVLTTDLVIDYKG